MDKLIEQVRNLVIANRILAREGVVDGFGHVSVRHPDNPERFLLACSRSPELVGLDDILEFDLSGEPIDARGLPLYIERFIHAGVYEARPDVNAVVHNHAPELIPFGITGTALRPVCHTAGRMGGDIPVWDIRDRFGDTNLLVVNKAQATDLAGRLGRNKVVLMRGHGCTVAADTLHNVVHLSIYARLNARLQMQAMMMGGPINFLTPGEIQQVSDASTRPTVGRDRTWEYLRQRAGCADI